MLDDGCDIHPLFHAAPSTPGFRTLRKRLVQQVREASDTCGMVVPGARWLACPIIACDLCGSQEGLQRMQVKALLDDWEARSPGRCAVRGGGR